MGTNKLDGPAAFSRSGFLEAINKSSRFVWVFSNYVCRGLYSTTTSCVLKRIIRMHIYTKNVLQVN